MLLPSYCHFRYFKRKVTSVTVSFLLPPGRIRRLKLDAPNFCLNPIFRLFSFTSRTKLRSALKSSIQHFIHFFATRIILKKNFLPLSLEEVEVEEWFLKKFLIGKDADFFIIFVFFRVSTTKEPRRRKWILVRKWSQNHFLLRYFAP